MKTRVTSVEIVDDRVVEQEARFTRNGAYACHLVTRVGLSSGRMVRYPNETLCGHPCGIDDRRRPENGTSAPWCPKCLEAALRHGFAEEIHHPEFDR